MADEVQSTSIRVKHPLPQLEDLIRRFSFVAGDEFKREVNEQLRATAVMLVGTEFERGEDPYGKAWKPTTSRDGRTLLDTGRLRNSFTSYGRISAGGFGIGTAVKYAAVHQYGAVIKAKTPAGLTFKLPHATRMFNRRTGARLKRNVVLSHWVTKQQVTIPQRQMVPEGEIGPIWMLAFSADVDAAVLAAMGGK